MPPGDGLKILIEVAPLPLPMGLGAVFKGVRSTSERGFRAGPSQDSMQNCDHSSAPSLCIGTGPFCISSCEGSEVHQCRASTLSQIWSGTVSRMLHSLRPSSTPSS
jgi:hypothetical protein